MKQTSNQQGRTGRLISFCGTLLISTIAVQSAITVTTLNDSGPGSLRQAIADAAPGDTIDFGTNGTITLTSGKLVISKSLSIIGPGAMSLTVSGNNARRVFEVSSPSASVIISGLTVANGNGDGDAPGGGGFLTLGNLTLNNCRVMNCTNSGVFMNGSSARLTVLNSSFIGNYRPQGGAISCQPGGQIVAVNSLFSSNSASAGGAVEIQSYGANSTGAFTNCTFTGNVAANGGGAMMNAYSTAVLSSCTIVSNTPNAFHNWYGTTVLFNDIVADNGNGDCDGVVSGGFNLIRNTGGCTIIGDTNHNIYGQDPKLGPLADNGGPTPTHALLPGSPAINAGSSPGLATDQRGQPRPFLYPGYPIVTDGSDIGAYELQKRTVTTLADSGPGSIRQSIADATPGETIDFATNGTITLTGGELVVGKNLTISGPGATNLTLSGNNASGVLRIANGNVEISGLRISNGRSLAVGGGILISNSATVAISDCAILANRGVNGGGGIYNQGTLTLTRSSVSSNTGEYLSGCGIWNSGTLTASNCTVFGNQCTWGNGFGGGLYNDGKLSILNSVISSNSPGNNGGGIYIVSGPVILSGCTISENGDPNIHGGGIDAVASSSNLVTIVDSTICRNRGYQGAGIQNGIGTMLITNCTVSGNLGGYAGAGIMNQAVLTIASSTVCSNSSGRWGAGVGNAFSGVVSIRNSIVAGNTAALGEASDVYSFDKAIVSQDYNLIGTTNGCIITGATTHNIYGVDPKLGPLANNGGPTPTHALRWDSPAIDAGGMAGPAKDQRGVTRPVAGTAAGIAAFDIGAYEFVPVAPVITQQPVTQTISPNGTVVVTVGDTGNPPPTYQWYFAGSPIPGATGPTLVLTNVGPAQVGCYSVTLTNFMGGFVSQSACLWLDTLKMYAGVNVFGPIGGNCTIQYTSDLNAKPVQWTTLTNVTIETMPQVFIDYGSADQPKRFYRTVPQ